MQEEQTTIPLYYGTDVRTTARSGLLHPFHPGTQKVISVYPWDRGPIAEEALVGTRVSRQRSTHQGSVAAVPLGRAVRGSGLRRSRGVRGTGLCPDPPWGIRRCLEGRVRGGRPCPPRTSGPTGFLGGQKGEKNKPTKGMIRAAASVVSLGAPGTPSAGGALSQGETPLHVVVQTGGP